MPQSVPRYPGLEVFVPSGFYFVALFFFFSGYGLFKSVKTKPDYLRGFLKKRILPILYTSYVVIFMYYAFRLIQGEPFSVTNLLIYLSQARLCNVNGWYVICLPIIYLGFYLAFKFCKKENAAVAVMWLIVTAYCLIGTFVDHNNWFFCGEWWYNSVYGFMVGLFFAKYEEKFLTHLKKYYWLYLILSFVLIVPLYTASKLTTMFVSYYAENFDPTHRVIRRWICLISENLASFSFMFFMLLLNLKCKIGNKVLDFMGTITLEFYLVHGLFVELFSYRFVGYLPPLWQCKNAALYVLAVFVISVPICVLLKKSSQLIFAHKR